MTAPDSDFTEAGRKLFAGACDFIWASSKVEDLPPMKGLEFALAGRSNVGKSSLLNAITGRKALARTSHTPGRTQQLNFFRIGADVTLVDMPGYGFAAVGKQVSQNWTKLIHDYLRGRANLGRVFVLIDARHGLKEIDAPVLDTLDKAAVSYQIVLTKADQVPRAEWPALVERTTAAVSRRPAAFPEVLLTSSRDSIGVPELRAAVARLVSERG
jgi:GTP-binding protein